MKGNYFNPAKVRATWVQFSPCPLRKESDDIATKNKRHIVEYSLREA